MNGGYVRSHIPSQSQRRVNTQGLDQQSSD